MFAHNFTAGTPINRPQVPLTLDQLRQVVPSAFAVSAHESRSNRYTYVPTVAVIEGMMRAGFQPYRATQSRSRIEGKTEFTKHMIRFRSQEKTALVVGDTIPEIALINSHDGTSTYQLSLAMWRLACSNGLMVAESEINAIRVPHKGNIIDMVIEGSNHILGGTAPAVAQIEGWNRLQLTAGEQTAFAEAAHTLRFSDAEGKVSTPITAAQLLTPRRREDAGNTMWQVLNRTQENVIRGGLHGVQRDDRGRRVRRVTTRAVSGIDQDARLNRAMWQLAERMAELKGERIAA